MSKDKIINGIFYVSTGLVAALGIFVAFYSVLRLDATLTDIVNKSSPRYLWLYMGLTVGSIILFGLNASLFTYRIRKYSFPSLTAPLEAGLGSIVGLLAAACPVCGSTLLSAIGLAGGLSAFPLGGLELKIASFVLMALPVFILVREIRNFDCGKKICPKPRDARFKEDDLPWLIIILAIGFAFAMIAWNMFYTDPVAAAICNIPVRL
jgi:hypothetical protein